MRVINLIREILVVPFLLAYGLVRLVSSVFLVLAFHVGGDEAKSAISEYIERQRCCGHDDEQQHG